MHRDAAGPGANQVLRWCLLDGALTEAAQAQVSVWDRGFLVAEGVYEVMSVQGGRLFAWERHRRRLRNSLAGLGVALPLGEDDLRAALEGMARANGAEGGQDGQGDGRSCIYLQVTAGVPAQPGRDYLAPATPQLFAYQFAAPLPEKPAPLSVCLLEDIRWRRVDIKVIGLTAVGILKRAAAAAGHDDAILHRDGQINEATASNVFASIGGAICTPPLSHRLLGGVTRAVLLDALRAGGHDVQERPIGLDELRAAEEIWTTSTVLRLQPVASLDGAPLPQVAGPAFRLAADAFAQALAEEGALAASGAPA